MDVQQKNCLAFSLQGHANQGLLILRRWWLRCYSDSIPTTSKLKIIPDHGGNQTYDLWNASLMLCQLRYVVRSVQVCDIWKLRLVPSIPI